MRNISELRDIELYELVDRSLKNMIHMGLINDDTVNVENVNIEEDYSFLNLNDYFDMDILRGEEKYQEMLKLATRMEYINFNMPSELKDYLVIHMLLLEELRRRKIHINDKGTYVDNKMKKSLAELYNKPINEIPATGYYGGQTNDLIHTFDYPVRKACSILFSRGYVPYWSSANSKDIYSREGKIVKYKNVAYILIRREELTDNLKEQLRLDANVVFLSAVREYSDNGVYYGIWTEITSGMKCGEISELLAKEALKLPDLTDKKNSRKR